MEKTKRMWWQNVRKIFETWKKFFNEAEQPPLVVAFFGGFKPPHKGHLAVVEDYLSMPDVERVYIIFGQKPRMSSDGSVVIDAEDSRAIWELFLSGIFGGDRVQLIESHVGNPVIKAAELAWDESLSGKRITAGFGPKESSYGNMFLKIIDATKKRVGNPIAVPVMVSSNVDVPSVSATMIRDAIASGDVEFIKSAIPNWVNAEEYINLLK